MAHLWDALPDVTVVADAGMISEANQKAIEAAGLSFILGMKIPDVVYQVDKWRREQPGGEIPDGHVFVQLWPAGPSAKRRDQWIYYQFRAGRARRTLRGIDEQVAKAAKAVAGLAPVKRNRFIALGGAVKSVNRAGTESARPGRAERLRHQPRGVPRRHPGHGDLRFSHVCLLAVSGAAALREHEDAGAPPCVTARPLMSTRGRRRGVFPCGDTERNGARWPIATNSSPPTCVTAASITCA
jgi:hypothetical protein